MKQRLLRGPYQAARVFFATEAAGGILLIVASLAAMVLANSSYAAGYFELIHHKFGPLSVGHWINDALMALFFLLVGLEVKREFLEGELSTWQERRLPGLAAICGVLVPAAIYAFVNRSNPHALDGWAIPTATDIAFALAILALLGRTRRQAGRLTAASSSSSALSVIPGRRESGRSTSPGATNVGCLRRPMLPIRRGDRCFRDNNAEAWFFRGEFDYPEAPDCDIGEAIRPEPVQVTVLPQLTTREKAGPLSRAGLPLFNPNFYL